MMLCHFQIWLISWQWFSELLQLFQKIGLDPSQNSATEAVADIIEK